LSEPVEEDVTILAASIFAQEGFAKKEIALGLASGYDVKNELVGPEDAPAIARLSAVHPLDLNTGSIEQSSCFLFRLSQDRRLYTGTIVHQDRDPRAFILRGRDAAP
jgi:hypothetical protein